MHRVDFLSSQSLRLSPLQSPAPGQKELHKALWLEHTRNLQLL